MWLQALEWPGLVALWAVLLRCLVARHAYSGHAAPPLYGDYEAQRHWQEITVNLPVRAWYTNSSDNDLLYWGLDYPPLTAYHSWLLGQVARLVNPEYVELHASRGYESYMHKLFMRYTVLGADLLVLLPAALAFRRVVASQVGGRLCYAALLLNPGLILVDSGHFQYNNVSLGLCVAAVAALVAGRHCLGAVLFSAALNYKQMELYHALPFFFFLLAKCAQENTFKDKLVKLLKIGACVIATFVIIYLPFLSSYDSIAQVLHRIFPINRGIFEDKVASIWCSLSIIIKFKSILSNSQMALICLLSTAVCCVPACANLLRYPTSAHLKHALVNISLVFFLLSFHVHEKSILLVTVPACLLYDTSPSVVAWLVSVSVFSMLPLLIKDGLLVPSASLLVLWALFHRVATAYSRLKRRRPAEEATTPMLQRAWLASHAAMLALALASVVLQPPPRYPDLWPVLISLLSCAHFCAFALFFHYRQFTLAQGTKQKLK